MNPLTKVKLINELNEREASLGVRESVSWHTEYKDSAWIFVGGFPYELTEGDLICVFSQYGEIVNINLVRDKKTGKSKGFCFVCYEDQRSTILAVDNFNSIKIKGRTIRVDHVKNYRPPKDGEDIDDVTKHLREEGCAPTVPVPSSSSEEDEQYVIPVKKAKKDKKEKKKKKKEKKRAEKEKEKEKRNRAPSSSPSPPLPPATARVKEEKQDAAYDKYNQKNVSGEQQNGQKVKETERVREEEERRRRMDREREEERRRDRWETDRDRRDDRRREMDRDRRDDRRDDGKREMDRDRREMERRRDRDADRRRDVDKDDRRR
ncbi:RNA-binding motif protein, X-linked 2 [Cololabis saira]|uniref:RNA-binding motif protein, X-linked 2 n=1 Tax=Cololabis saira TaxID=129043 RepID=UPI002AD4263C|nr:RNA-binding motif protein, X-linked 2 [Cololabis saira]